MKKWFFLLSLSVILLISCKKDDINQTRDDERYVATDVIVKTRSHFTADQVFAFINTLDHDVQYIYNQTYTSELSPDSLQYVLDYLNAKPYTHEGDVWKVSGYIHYNTHRITVFPRLFHIKNISYQQDWLTSVNFLKLKEDTASVNGGWIIYFHVPAGTEKTWVQKFKAYDFVEWADLNYIREIIF